MNNTDGCRPGYERIGRRCIRKKTEGPIAHKTVLRSRMGRWREPTPDELRQIDEHTMGMMGGEKNFSKREELPYRAKDSYPIVLENYTSESPGYSGKMVFIVWGIPEAFNVFIENGDGGLKPILQAGTNWERW